MRLPRTPLLPMLATLAAALWMLAMLLAAGTLPNGTVVGLTGQTNSVDNLDVWRALPLPHALVYGLGDFLCHQMASRSIALQGNQLPVDARMTGIFAAAVVGLALASRPRLAPVRWYLGEALLDAMAMPARLRPRARLPQVGLALGLVALALLPAAVDVAFTSQMGAYDSTLARRLWTGSLAGVAGGLTLGAALRVLETMLRAMARRAGLTWVEGPSAP